MNIIKCKMCGGTLEAVPGDTIAVCEYCGSKQTVSSAGDEKRVNLFNRANRLRMSSEFDRAATIYEQIIAEFPEEAEAYWGLCLCNYGIEYVDDPKTGNKIPTCHRASFENLCDDENYKLAIENADMAARLVYQEEAKEIDRIMGEILSISKNESPYDVFICYKETDDVGSRTPDSVIAQDIYDALTERGYKVFFSRITLEDKLGLQYEPYIFAALNSAKVMLAVGTDYENFNAVWVKNEWSRFLRLMAKDKSKVLIPCYKDMDPYDLPVEFKGLQAQDLNKLGYVQDLLRGINKITGKVKNNSGNTVLDSNSIEKTLSRAEELLQGEEWERAKYVFEQALQIDEENETAYLGMLLADLKLTTIDQVFKLKEPFENNYNYRQLLQYAEESTRETLLKANQVIKDKNKKARRRIIGLTAGLLMCVVFTVIYITIIAPRIKYSNWINTLKTAAVGDVIEFGSYEQDNNTSNGAEPIQWIVLGKEGDHALVISKDALASKPFYSSSNTATWERSTVREWLNKDFVTEAFNEKEVDFICLSSVSADKNPDFISVAGNDTEDYVFLLSIEEVNKYFETEESRRCSATSYAKDHGVKVRNDGYCSWWLRTSGNTDKWAAYVNQDGEINSRGANIKGSIYAVRPAMWITFNP
ncbi:MAG: toll/interleukin-1 receptor domain-containing protein [Oscillospiraceae bacterium]|nr:toll/interleukin-1 receptor domain-containing protein [Oscillospiraceae bacterium]